jgi:hypothetical protein
MPWITQKWLVPCKHLWAQELRTVITAWATHGIVFTQETCRWWWQKLLSVENERKTQCGSLTETKITGLKKKTKNKPCLFIAECPRAKQISVLGLLQGLRKPPSEPDSLGMESPFMFDCNLSAWRVKTWQGWWSRGMGWLPHKVHAP